MGEGGGVDGWSRSSRRDLRERAPRKLRARRAGSPSSCCNALWANGDRGVGGRRGTSSEKTSKTERTGDVARDARTDGAGERFANGSSSSRSGGGELREGVTGPSEEISERGDVAPE